MTEERKIQLIAEVDATGTRAGFNEIQRQAGTMADSVQRASQTAERAIAGVGGGANTSARNVESAQRNLIGSIQRSTAAMEAGAKSGSAYYEVLARQRGVDPAVLEPYLVQLRAIEAAQRRSTEALNAGTEAQVRAADAAKIEAQAQRDANQAKATREAFLNSLREQISLYGRSSDEVLRFRAAQAGVADSAAPLILQLQNVRAAHEAIAKAARDQAQAQREATQAQTTRDNFTAGLREQIQLFGLSTAEVMKYRAAQAGAADAAAPLIAQLQALRAAQEQVASAARSAEAAQQKAAQVQAGKDAFLAQLREQISLYGRSSDEVLKYRAAQAGVASSASQLIMQLQNVRAAHDAIAKAARDEAEAQKKALQVQTGQNSFITGLEQQALAIGKTRSQLLELQAAQLGVSARAAPFIAQLRQSESGLNQVGMSARATAAALRGVPAQFTDIVTSIQGGQAPLTVFLQQGGQLKDMFGGTGEAAKALGGYLLGLVNPLTVGAAAAAVLGFAYHEGAAEARAYSQALILSGNAAGSTAGKLSDMARSVSQVIGTQGAAAEAITALVGTGKVSAANLEQFSVIAIKAQRALGQSVSDTATEFSDLAKTPATSLDRLNEKYHFLTGAVYEQVKGLQNQGRAYEAGLVAQQAYATAFDGVTTKVTANLGAMQRGWVFVKDGAKGAWDAMLGVGRADSLSEQLAKVQASIAKAQKPFEAGVGGNAEDRMALKANLDKEESIKKQIALENTKSGIAADQARFNAADLEWSKTKEQYLTRQQQRDMELDAVRNRGLAAGISDIAINEALIKVRKKYADLYNDGIDSNIAALKRRSAVEDMLSKRAIDQINFQKNAGMINEDQAIERTTAEELAQFDAQRKGLVAQLGFIKQKQNSLKDQKDKQGEINALDESRRTRVEQGEQDLFLLEQKRFRLAAENSANLFDQSMAERVGLVAQVTAQRDYNEEIGKTSEELLILTARRREDLAVRKDQNADIAEGLDFTGEKAAEYRAQAAALRERSAAEKDGFVKGRDPYVNLRFSLKRYGDEASNVGAQIGAAMDNAFKSSEDALVGFVKTGKLSFSSLATSILSDLARIAAKQALSPIFSYLGSTVGSYFGMQPTTGAGSTGWDGYGNTLSGARAAGGPVTGGLSYLVGEKGPEVFTPTGSGSIIPNSQLGGGVTQITIANYITDSGTRTEVSGGSGADARAMADGLAAKMKAVISQEMRQGGILWNQQMRGAG